MIQCEGILVVEDEPCIREVVCQLLEMEGYSVHSAENGQQALERLRKMEYPVLILLDLMMPVMNGWQFLEARKKNRLFAELPVVVVSAVADQARGMGADEYMRKPPDIDVLLEVISHHFKPSHPDQSTPEVA